MSPIYLDIKINMVRSIYIDLHVKINYVLEKASKLF